MSQRNPTEIECVAYVEALITNGGDRTKAFKCAFPLSNAKPDTLNQAASRFDKLPKVRARFDELQAMAKDKAEEAALYTINDKRRWLIEIIQYGVSGDESETKQRNPSSAVAAIKELNLMDGDHAPDKREYDFTPGSLVKVTIKGK